VVFYFSSNSLLQTGNAKNVPQTAAQATGGISTAKAPKLSDFAKVCFSLKDEACLLLLLPALLFQNRAAAVIWL